MCARVRVTHGVLSQVMVFQCALIVHVLLGWLGRLLWRWVTQCHCAGVVLWAATGDHASALCRALDTG